MRKYLTLVAALALLSTSTPAKPRWLDKKFLAVATVAVASNVLSWQGVEHCRKAVHGEVGRCEGRYGNPGALMGARVGLTAGMIALGAGYRHHFPEDKLWAVFLAAPIALNGASAWSGYHSPSHPCAGTTLVC